jgi:hypothetical protein
MATLTLEKIERAMSMMQNRTNENFYLVVHPEYAYRLKVVQARDKYYLESHIRRWEKKYGKPYPMGESGCFNSVTFLDSKRL